MLALLEGMDPQKRIAEGAALQYQPRAWQPAFILSHEVSLLCGTVVDGFSRRFAQLARGEAKARRSARAVGIGGGGRFGLAPTEPHGFFDDFGRMYFGASKDV